MNPKEVAETLVQVLGQTDKIVNASDVVTFGERNPGASTVLVFKDGSIFKASIRQIAASDRQEPKPTKKTGK